MASAAEAMFSVLIVNLTDWTEGFFVLFCFVLVKPHDLQDLSSPTRDQAHALCSKNVEP